MTVLSRVDIDRLRADVDLGALAQQAGARLRQTGRGWFAGPCPFCGGRDRFVVHHAASAGWRWLCRGCGDSKYHDAIDFYQRWRQVDFHQACTELAAHNGHSLSPAVAPVAARPRLTQPPVLENQATAMQVVSQGEVALWSPCGERARDWLHARGLTDDTLRHWRIGYIPGRPDSWLQIAEWRVPCGILIPTILPDPTGERVWCLKVRRAAGSPKYMAVKGLGAPALFGAHTLKGRANAVLTEGEFDAMLLHQVAGDLAGCITLGSMSARLDVTLWAGYLLPIARLLVAYDVDAAGDQGAAHMTALTQRAQRIAVPALRGGDKDITDYHAAGGDLRIWLEPHLDLPNDYDEELITTILTWAESKGYMECTFSPEGHIVVK